MQQAAQAAALVRRAIHGASDHPKNAPARLHQASNAAICADTDLIRQPRNGLSLQAPKAVIWLGTKGNPADMQTVQATARVGDL
jgi:hypothetical protein